VVSLSEGIKHCNSKFKAIIDIMAKDVKLITNSYHEMNVKVKEGASSQDLSKVR
jgi:hypothetical protein